MSVLFVVEDDPVVRSGLRMLLEMEGYQVHCASNGQEALHLLKVCRKSPCMILLDLMMPVMDGLEFRRRQLQDPEVSDVPVVIITGKEIPGDIEELRPLKVIRKPFPPNEILSLLEEHCPAE